MCIVDNSTVKVKSKNDIALRSFSLFPRVMLSAFKQESLLGAFWIFKRRNTKKPARYLFIRRSH